MTVYRALTPASGNAASVVDDWALALPDQVLFGLGELSEFYGRVMDYGSGYEAQINRVGSTGCIRGDIALWRGSWPASSAVAREELRAESERMKQQNRELFDRVQWQLYGSWGVDDAPTG